MSVSRDIVATWTGPRRVMRRLLDQGRREDRALVFVMGACFLIFVAQWPRLSREAYLDPSVPLDARIGGALMGWLLIAPLAAYGLAAFSHAVARLFRGVGTWYSARLALFWTMLATTPAWLFYGLVTGFIGPGPASTAVGLVLLLAFGAIWGMSLWEAETEAEAKAAA
jgi:hypothetical protein